MCKYDEAFTETEMFEETDFCEECKLDCVKARKKKKSTKMQIPAMWIYEYIESLPETSPSRIAITNMIIQFLKEQES